MSLAIFDLDNTLLAGDSDYLWGQFLARQGYVDGEWYERENRRYYDQYLAGTLNIFEFLEFSLKPLSEIDPKTLKLLHNQFMQECIQPTITPQARELVEKHRSQGHELLIITATNRFITAPIALEFNILNLLATDPEQINGRYTGKVSGVPCFQQGKVTRLESWLSEQDLTLDESWFYSDSHNDLPLLERVTHPVAVNPDKTLLEHAQKHSWSVLELPVPDHLHEGIH